MLQALRRLGKRIGSLGRGDYTDDGMRPVENIDAGASQLQSYADPTGHGSSSIPPNYVPPVDEGRPRH
jgi:hypothetical protein